MLTFQLTHIIVQTIERSNRQQIHKVWECIQICTNLTGSIILAGWHIINSNLHCVNTVTLAEEDTKPDKVGAVEDAVKAETITQYNYYCIDCSGVWVYYDWHG